MLFLFGCGSNDCCEHLYTETLSEKIYIEKYRTYCGGVYAGEAYTSYVTDSTTFRFKSWITSEHSFLNFDLDGETLKIQELERIHKNSIVNSERFNIISMTKHSNNAMNNPFDEPLIKTNLISNEIRRGHFSNWKIDENYSVQTYQSFCKPTKDSSSFINSVYLAKDTNLIQLLVTYDMNKWAKGLDHYNYNINDSILTIEEKNSYDVVDTLRMKEFDFTFLKKHKAHPCE